jgi:hypothetical protein
MGNEKVNTESDNYSYTNDMIGRAVENFKDIDTSGSGQLNLLDILFYERQGPEQKQIGLVLEHNYATLKGFDGDQKPHDYIDLGDLQKAELLGGSDMNAINKEKNDQALTTAKDAALVAGTTFGAMAVGGAVLTGPESLILSAPGVAAVTGIGATIAYFSEMKMQNAMQDKAQNLHP